MSRLIAAFALLISWSIGSCLLAIPVEDKNGLKGASDASDREVNRLDHLSYQSVLTLNERFSSSDIVLFAKLKSKFSEAQIKQLSSRGQVVEVEVVDVLKGDQKLDGKRSFEVYLKNGQLSAGALLLTGNRSKNLSWAIPEAVTTEEIQYLKSAFQLDATGVERLAFFLDSLEHSSRMIAENAHLEFSLAGDDDLIALKDRLDHVQLMKWIQKPNLSPRRAQLYASFLTICGLPSVVPELEQRLKNRDPNSTGTSPAMLYCYLTLKGADGLQLVDQSFLKEGTYMDMFSAVTVLRHFADQNSSPISRDQICSSLRIVLDRAKMADLVIPDLARLEDWSATDQIARLYNESSEENAWIRVPAYMYMYVCPLEEAKQHLVGFEKLDPQTAKRARFFMPQPNEGDTDSIESPSANDQNSGPESEFFRPVGRSPWQAFPCFFSDSSTLSNAL